MSFQSILTKEHLQNIDRVVILGTTGAGKTTVANQISNVLHLPMIELDQFKWKEGWTSVSDDEFKERVKNAVKADRWIVDGNYGIVRDLVWFRAQAIIWLDYSFTRVFWQLLVRTIRRAIFREKLWNNNIESWKRSFFSKESILLWALKSYPEKKKKYPDLLLKEEKAGRRIFRILSPSAIRF